MQTELNWRQAIYRREKKNEEKTRTIKEDRR